MNSGIEPEMQQDTKIYLQWFDETSNITNAEVLPIPVTIGRAPENDIVLFSEEVSRHHACLNVYKNQVMLVDLGSLNRICLDGEKMSGIVPLTRDTRFQIGPVCFTVLNIHPAEPGTDFPVEQSTAQASIDVHPCPGGPLPPPQEAQFLKLIDDLSHQQNTEIFVEREKVSVQFEIDYVENRLTCEAIKNFGGIKLTGEQIQALGFVLPDNSDISAPHRFTIQQNISFVDKLFKLILG